MKVLQINSVCGYGSTGRIAVDLYHEIEKEGNECIIAYGRGKAPEGIRTIKIGNLLDMYWQIFLTRFFDLHGHGSIIATKKLIKKIKKYNPDIIHLHNIHGYYINIKILFDYIKKYNKRVVWTLHDCWAFTGHCAHFDYINCTKWINRCEKCSQKKLYPTSIFWDNSKQNYFLKNEIFNGCSNLTIVSPSKWLANKAEKSFLKYPTEVIYNGIDLEQFKETNSNLKEKYNLNSKFIVLGVANVWSERKGIHVFNYLADQLDENYKIVLIGIDNKNRKMLNKNILAVNRTASIEELAKFYTLADVFVNPTLEETFSLVNVEAMACGTPVITFNTGGSPESLNENTGIVVEKNNKELLLETIKQFNKEKYSGCREQAKKFDKNKQYKRYIELYSKVMK